MAEDKPRLRPLTPPRNLTGELVQRLTEEITSGRFVPNEQLPTEQEMIASLEVSRTVVREAIAALRAEGLVEARQGAGFFIAKNPQRPFRIDPLGIRCVGNFRKTNAIVNHSPGERQARGELTIEEVAQKLAVSYSTVQRMIKRQHLPGHQVCPGAPWIIRCEDVDALCAGDGHDKERHKAPSSGLPGQQTLAFP